MSPGADSVVIAGGGLAAVRTAQALRESGHAGDIRMLSAEHQLPYDRPPLSKGVLQGKLGEAQIRLLKPEQLDALSIRLEVGCEVVGLDRDAACVRLSDGRTIGYGQLVVATGARPVRLPQFEGFSNVHVLRNHEDAVALREALQPSRRIGIVGAGFVGLEIASVAVSLGCHVDVVEMAPAPLAAILGSELGLVIQHWHEGKGIHFHCGVSVSGVLGRQGEISVLQLADGRELPVDAVVIGVGQTPNVEWLSGSGLAIDGGVRCDEYGRTDDPRIFAVGDAACRRVGDRYLPTRHWTATTEQAHRVALAMLGRGQSEPVIEDHYFWSDQHGLRLQFAGNVPQDPELVWISGGPDQERFVVLCCSGDEVGAVFSLGSVREFLLHSMPLRQGQKVSLSAVTTPLRNAG